jgi:hypothetical protein
MLLRALDHTMTDKFHIQITYEFLIYIKSFKNFLLFYYSRTILILYPKLSFIFLIRLVK